MYLYFEAHVIYSLDVTDSIFRSTTHKFLSDGTNVRLHVGLPGFSKAGICLLILSFVSWNNTGPFASAKV